MNAAPRIEPVIIDNMALPVNTVMPNKAMLYTLQGCDSNIVRLELLFKGGYAVQSMPLQATFVNRMLREGAGGFSSDEISRKLDYYGAWIESYSSQNCNHLTLYCLRKHFEPLLELLLAMVTAPSFPEENLETIRRSGKAAFEVNSKKVDSVAQRYFEQMLWGENHPLGHIVKAADYDNITRESLLEYYNKVYKSSNLSIFLSGDVDCYLKEKVISILGTCEWGSNVSCETLFVAAPSSLLEQRRIELEGALQSAVKIGFMAMDVSDSDFHIFRFLTVLLGGYFGSRLMSNIREENGYTYHIWAEVDAYGERNAFMISSEVANEYVEPCIKEIYNEIERLCNEPITAEEVEHVRNYILGEMCRECEGLTAKSEVFVNAWLSGESFESVNEYLEVVKTVSAEDLNRVARRFFSIDNMIEVVVGGNIRS